MKEDLYLKCILSMISTLDANVSLKNVFNELNPYFHADGAFINVFDQQKREVVFVAHCREDGETAPLGSVKPPPGLVPLRADRSSYIGSDIETDPFTKYVVQAKVGTVKSFLMLSLDQDGAHLGVVCFYSRFLDNFSEEQRVFLARLHDMFCLVTSNALNKILFCNNAELEYENSALKTSEEQGRRNLIRAFEETTPALSPLAAKIRQIGPTEVTVLILGETGTGKEVIADLVHRLSKRRNAPFIKVNCGAIAETLMDAEFFGYEKGAFTDAKAAKAGIFEQADGGTLFLDEIGELSPASQVRLLRVLQQRVVRRLGSEKDKKVDFRLIAATNRDLSAMAQEGSFRQDLLYRLNLFPLEVPPLRERRADIAPLSKLFLSRLVGKYGLTQKPLLSEQSVLTMTSYDWPGNVRELENTLERSLLLSNDSREIEVVLSSVSEPAFRRVPADGIGGARTLPDFETMQKDYFVRLLRSCSGRISGEHGAAKAAGLHPNTLRSRLEKLGIDFKNVGHE
ncbi:sigma-54-dependent Fis family transcriptional regulator [uncultured Parasutterella sp.]|mgnify:FL=1|uniref:sigma-54-dependent Fis family transcriptional regulator n=1 Tax=uncultured Parasutterella sp. TaxID=1263098 RepID=UPI00259595CF|nr:sigma-54-dependent Fis family transcriptional regulator [uncultured Parasutterella sp.]